MKLKMRKKDIIFVLKNFIIAIFLWYILPKMYIIENQIMQKIFLVGMVLHIVLLFGGEALIYCIYTARQENINNFKVFIVTILIHILLKLILKEGMGYLLFYFGINQFLGFIIGSIIRIINEEYRL